MELAYHPHDHSIDTLLMNNYKCELFSKQPAPFFVIWFKRAHIVTEELLTKLELVRFKNDIKINKYQDRVVGYGSIKTLGSESEMIKRINEGVSLITYYDMLPISLIDITHAMALQKI